MIKVASNQTAYNIFRYYIINHPEVVDEFLQENANSPKNQALIEEICGNHLVEMEMSTKRRFIKTHLPFSLLPPDLLKSGCKVTIIIIIIINVWL